MFMKTKSHNGPMSKPQISEVEAPKDGHPSLSKLKLLMLMAPLGAAGWAWLRSMSKDRHGWPPPEGKPEGLTGYAANWSGHIESEGRLPSAASIPAPATSPAAPTAPQSQAELAQDDLVPDELMYEERVGSEVVAPEPVVAPSAPARPVSARSPTTDPIPATTRAHSEDVGLAAQSLLGLEVVDLDGASLGDVQRVYARAGGVPEWLTVGTDRKGFAIPFVKQDVTDKITVPYSKGMIEDAPIFDADELSLELEMLAYQHYTMRRELHGELDQTQPGEEVLRAISLG
jgi:sporulation protein YlmC with PRC-barrel domain